MSSPKVGDIVLYTYMFLEPNDVGIIIDKKEINTECLYLISWININRPSTEAWYNTRETKRFCGNLWRYLSNDSKDR